MKNVQEKHFTSENSKLYSPAQIALASFLFPPTGGLLILAVNYHKLQKRFQAFISILLFIIISIAIFELSYHVSADFPWLPINFTLSFLIYLIAIFFQGKDIKRHFYLNFRNASWLKTLGWTFLCYVTKILILGLITAFVMLS